MNLIKEVEDRQRFIEEVLVRLCRRQAKVIGDHIAPMLVDNGGERLMRKPEVILRTGLSESTIRRMELAGKFPRRRQLGLRAIGWSSVEVEEWLQNPQEERQREK